QMRRPPGLENGASEGRASAKRGVMASVRAQWSPSFKPSSQREHMALGKWFHASTLTSNATTCG
ncbi:MAG: hypothetical protein ACO4AU_14025, partial [bacterium]